MRRIKGACLEQTIHFKLKEDMEPKDRLYYTLLPVYAKDNLLFTPIDNKKVLMRPIISKDQALELIDKMEDMDLLWVREEGKREEIYKTVLRSGNPEEWIRMIKTLYLRGKKRLESGKKVTVGDERYLKMAEESLLGEMAIALEMPKGEVKNFIIKRASGLSVE